MVQGGGYREKTVEKTPHCSAHCTLHTAHCTLHSEERAVDMKGDTHEIRVGQQDFFAQTIVGNRNERFSLL